MLRGILLGAVVAALVAPAAAATEEEIEAAIQAGLAWLATQQDPNDGSWGEYECDRVAYTGLVVLKFECRARELGLDPLGPDYEYHQQVEDGLNYILQHSYDIDISSEPDADGDGDGWGTYFNNCPGNHDTYNSGIAMMAIAASGHPELYEDVLQDALDWMAFAQNNPECGVHRGGWRYDANPCTTSDNSNGGYASMGLGYAAASPSEGGMGLMIPPFVKDELSLWIDALQDPVDGDDNDGGGDYCPGCGGFNILETGNLLYEMALVGDTQATQRVRDAVDYVERHWADPGGGGTGWRDHRQAMFTMMKGFEGLHIDLIDLDDDGVSEHDWWDEVTTHLVGTQNPDGSWPEDPWAGPIMSTAWALLTLEKCVPPPAPEGRVSVTEKGSVLIFPKVELRWNNAGDRLYQDTFISITNDYNRDVSVLVYFVSETCVCKFNDIVLTRNEPAWWSAFTGNPKGVSPFTVLDAPSPDPEDSGPSPELVLRGFIVAFAYDDPETPEVDAEINWNHLTGEATIVNYDKGFAWEYHAYAFAALTRDTGRQTGTPGELNFDGAEFDYAFDRLLLDFIASGSEAFSRVGAAPVTLTHDTDLTLLIVDQDLRQGGAPPITKARFSIWNENEVSFSGLTHCFTKWDQVLLSTLGSHFLVRNLHTDKGKAWIDGVQDENLCPGSDYHALLGVAAEFLDMDAPPDGKPDRVAGDHLIGTGTESTTLLFDPPEGPQPATVDSDPDERTPGSSGSGGLTP